MRDSTSHSHTIEARRPQFTNAIVMFVNMGAAVPSWACCGSVKGFSKLRDRVTQQKEDRELVAPSFEGQRPACCFRVRSRSRRGCRRGLGTHLASFSNRCRFISLPPAFLLHEGRKPPVIPSENLKTLSPPVLQFAYQSGNR